ncbi:MAG: endonuclease/exonuclease/phosphatase family protein [Opitutales bacterium]|nr:endonuclease/exonuclease/phosphatase family protein [Opitutales bacterium]
MKTQKHCFARLFLLLAGLLSVSLTGCSEESPSGHADTIRAVSWNIEWFPGRSPRADAAQQAAHRAEILGFIPSLAADILFLQEIRDAEAAEAIVDALDGLDLHVVSHFRRPESELSQQLVIASRYPALAAFAEHFTGMAGGGDQPYRGFAFAALDIPTPGTVLVYCVHLKSNRGEAAVNIAMRETAADQILAHIHEMEALYAESGPVRVMVGGDFNLLLEQPAMAQERTLAKFIDEGFHWTWQGAPFEDRVTWPARGRFGDASFDHFVTRGLPETQASVIKTPAGELSDHRPVGLEITLE